MNDYKLRPLDPEEDIELFRVAYNWRSTPKRHTQPTRMPFETFSANNPTQLVIGLFNGELQAVYAIVEWEPRRFEVHFTSAKSAPKEPVRLGAQQVLNFMLENGAKEVVAFVVSRNRPLRRFVESIGFRSEARVAFLTCAEIANESNMTQRDQRKVFTKYAIRG